MTRKPILILICDDFCCPQFLEVSLTHFACRALFVGSEYFPSQPLCLHSLLDNFVLSLKPKVFHPCNICDLEIVGEKKKLRDPLQESKGWYLVVLCHYEVVVDVIGSAGSR